MTLCSSSVMLTWYLLWSSYNGVTQTQCWVSRSISQSFLASTIQRLFIVGRFPVTTILPLLKKPASGETSGFGITCIYKGDLVRVSGSDVSIQGWGIEDMDLFNKVVQVGLRIFRRLESSTSTTLSSVTPVWIPNSFRYA